MTTVVTASGPLTGARIVTRRSEVEAYLGVPFATTGPKQRFRPARPVEPWSALLDATRAGPSAPQNPDPMLAQSGFWQPDHDESGCLNLNVWTPRADDAGRAVMVWFHGGAYISGSNASGFNSGGELAGDLDVVVVSVNYRLGAFGFLALEHLLGGEFADSGNLAVLDQIAALEWVRDNIAVFGGDPANVTIFGESAGGAAVGTLLGVPRTHGLFRRAIIQSGTAERARPASASEAVSAEVLEAAGLRDLDAERLLTMSVAELLAAQATVVERHAERVIGLPLPFQPTVGGALLPALPVDAVASGVNGDVDLLVGTNLNEASFFTLLVPSGADGRSARDRAEQVVAEDLGGAMLDRYERVLADELGRAPSDAELLESCLSDRLYRQPTNRLLDARAAATGATYAYLFTWPSPLMDGALGACHALDVPFVFRQLERIEAATLLGDDPPAGLSEAMSTAWTSFARNGVPASPQLPPWPVYTMPARATMVLDVDCRLAHDPRRGLRELWAELR